MHTKAVVLLPENVCVSEVDPSFLLKLNTCNSITFCVVPKLSSTSPHFQIKVNLQGRNQNTTVAAMVDCKATAFFINERLVRENKICTHPVTSIHMHYPYSHLLQA